MSHLEQPNPQRIDAHHHLWRYNPADYGWIDDTMEVIRRDFLAEDLLAEMNTAAVDGTVAVQARQTLDETEWLLDVADRTPEIRGVVGWAPIAGQEFPAVMERFDGRAKLKGLRHIIQAEPDNNYILREDFNAGIRALRGSGLVYDILIFDRHLPQTIDFVDQHPDQIFVLDHIAKPPIAGGHLEPWATRLCKLAERPNVWCKVSGMVTEADWKTWTPESLKPYLDAVVEAFTPQRLLAGSDWPVCLLASGYKQWWNLLHSYFAPFTESERNAVFGETAAHVYNL